MSEGLRILIIEGNPADAGFIHEMLPQAGPLRFQVESVRKLSEALTRLEQKDIDLVLLNLVLPDSQGLQTFHTLQKAAPEVPVIVLAGNDDHELAITAVQDGAQDYLVKGQVSVRPLIRAVRYALARQKAAAVVRQSELKFRTLVESIPQKIFIKGGDYHYLSVNENYARDLRIKPEEAVGKTDYDFYPKELADKYRADDRRIMRKGQTEDFDEKYIQDGREIWVHTAKTPVRDEDGKITGVLGIFWDITERRLAEARLRESEERYRNLFEHMVEGYAYCRMIFENGEPVDWVYLSVNQMFEKQTGLKGVSGKRVSEVIPGIAEKDPELLKIYARVALTGKTERFEMFVQALQRWFAISVYSPEKEFFVAVFDVITERKKAEEAVRRSQMVFKDLFDNAPVGFHEIDAEGRIVHINNTELKQLGYAAGELLGQFVWKLSADEELSRRAALAKLAGEQSPPSKGFERMFRRKDGSTFPVWISDQVLNREDGAITGIRSGIQDITERKRAEAELNRERELWQTLLDASPDKIYFKDTQSRFIKCSKSQALDFGLKSPDEMVGKTDFDIFEESHARPAFEDEQAIIRTGRPIIDKEEREDYKDGHATWVASTKLPMRDDTGKIIGTMGISRDITDRKKAEEALGYERDLLRTLLDTSPDNIYFKDTQSRFVKCSKTQARHFGLESPDDLVGKTDFDFYPEAYARPRFEDEREIIRTGRPIIGKEEREGQKTGQVKWVSSTKMPWLDSTGKIIGIIGISRDITGHKRAEEAMRESERRFQTLAAISPVGIFRTDAQGQTTYVNPTWCEISGLAATDALGVGWLRAVHPDDQERLVQGWQAAARVQSTSKADYRFVHSDGTIFWVMGQAIPEKDDAGHIVGYVGTITDITGRKQAEEAVRESEERYHQLFDLASDAVILVDGETHRYMDVNQAAQRLYGYSREEFLQMTPEDVSFEPEKTHVNISAGDFHVPLRWHRKKDGGRFAVEITANQIIYRGRRTALVSLRDVTTRLQAEEALRDSEAFLNTVIETIPHMIFVKDAKDLRFVKFNKAGQELLGYSLAELAGKSDYDLFPKELADHFTENDRQVLRSREVVDIPEESVQTRGKGERTLHTKKIPISDNAGQLVYLLGISEDITEHKRAEVQLAEALHFNQKIISDAPVGIVVFKASGRCVLANETAARTLNATVSQLLEQDFRQIVSWRAAGMLQFAEEALARNEPRHCESNFLSTFGKEVSLVCHFSPFVQNGEPHLLLVFNDVTEKKKLEAQFLRAQRMESIGTLAGGIAHDLNNVLAPLLISVQLLRDKVTDDDGRKLITALEANVNRGADLVKQVLTFGRGIKGERVMIQIKHIALEIKGIIRETFQKSVRLQMDITPDLWKISGDATQIGQVMLNLCVNARDAMPEGGTLSIRLENTMLDETYTSANLEARPGRFVVVSVTDTGAGMTREVQDRIFEPFFTTKEYGKGTGLGLSTTLAIVKSHGGFIHCYSEPGKGSTFRVYFPAGDAPDVEPATAQPPGLLRGRNETVLVVDDEEPIRKIVKHILERYGYRVLLAANGAEAVKLYTSRRKEIAAVITDMAMPVMDGPATIAALKTINPGIKIIASSGFDPGNEAGSATRHFIAKPYTAEAVLNMLHEVLQESPAKQQNQEAELSTNGGMG